MPSPIGHMIAGYTAYVMMQGQHSEGRRYILGGALLSAVAADLDFLPGILLGEPGRFHQGPSHSVGAVLLYGIGIWVLLRSCKVAQAARIALVLACAYGTHLVLDFLAADTSPPLGIPLLWPFNDTHYIAPVNLFMDIQRFEGKLISVFVPSAFNRHNLLAVAWEVVLLLPLALLAYRRRTLSYEITVSPDELPMRYQRRSIPNWRTLRGNSISEGTE